MKKAILTASVLALLSTHALAMYHPDEGRWISRDPIEEVASTASLVLGLGDSEDDADLFDVPDKIRASNVMGRGMGASSVEARKLPLIMGLLGEENDMKALRLSSKFAGSSRGLYAFVENGPTSFTDYLGLAKVCCRPVRKWGITVGKHCYLDYTFASRAQTCALNRSNKRTWVGPEAITGGVCYEMGPVDCCFWAECLINQNNPADDDNDGSPYDRGDNNSNHWVNRRLEACGLPDRFGWRGAPVPRQHDPPFGGGGKNDVIVVTL